MTGGSSVHGIVVGLLTGGGVAPGTKGGTPSGLGQPMKQSAGPHQREQPAASESVDTLTTTTTTTGSQHTGNFSFLLTFLSSCFH